MDDLKHSPLYDQHQKLGARMVPFAGWKMPVQYEGIVAEHQAVREKAGVFDISHMGQFWVRNEERSGNRALEWLNGLLTNNVEDLAIGQGQYTLMLNEKGGVIDDLIVYRTGRDEFFLVVNAARIHDDFEWLYDRLEDTKIELLNASADFGALAVQGPEAARIFSEMTSEDAELPDRFGISQIETTEGNIVVCRTGYTGEDGFELFCPTKVTEAWWQQALDAGAAPCGLGARDSLRLEKCYPLNGNDLDEEHTPLEAGLGFAVDLEKGDFVGRKALEAQKKSGLLQRLVALRMTEKGPPPRPGYGIMVGGENVGNLTSGGLSPSLKAGIGMGYVKTGHHRSGTELKIEVRGKLFAAEVVKKPFL